MIVRMFLVISSTITIITGNLTTQENLILNAQEVKIFGNANYNDWSILFTND